MTTAAKATAPTPGAMVTTAPNCTSATSIEIMKTSIIDQRPIARTKRNSAVRSRSLPAQPACVATSMVTKPTSLSMGTTTLAKNTSAASGYIALASSSSTPPRMVLGAPAPSCTTVSTG